MYIGWLQIGDRFVDGPNFEIINNERAFAYAAQGSVCWLQECNRCPTAALVLPGGPTFNGVAADPAPWYDPDNPDTEGFYGVIGLEVVGADDSTRAAVAVNSITGGGVIGPVYHGPRTMVVRGMAIAEDECSLQAGLTWLNHQCQQTVDPCSGDSLTYFDCCPCICDEGDPLTECWVQTYSDLRSANTVNPTTGEPCDTDYFPTTYAQLKQGPSITSESFCSWIVIYRHLRNGPPSWSCCTDECVVPYMRQYHIARITGGPIMLQRPNMKSGGALAVFEFTVIAADPIEHTVLQRSTLMTSTGGDPIPLDEPVEKPDPFAVFRPGRPRRSDLIVTRPKQYDPNAETWVEQSVEAYDPSPVHLSDQRAHVVRLIASADALRVRVGMQSQDGTFVGYYLPSVPADMLISIDNQLRRITATALDGTSENIMPYVRDYDGNPVRWLPLGTGTVTLTVYRAPEDAVPVHVELLTASVSAA